MTRLVVVELRRLLARRLILFAAIGVLVIIGITAFSANDQVYQLTPARVAQVKAEQLQPCLDSQAQARQTDPTADFHCTEIGQFGNPGAVSSTFATVATTSVSSMAYFLIFVAFLVGVSFVAAEFSSGAISTWLTYEPRRGRVYASKLVAVGTGVLLVAVVAVALVVVAVYLIARSNQIVGTTSGDPGRGLLGTAVRTIAVVGIAGVLGAVVAALLRHTAAALGLAIGYLVVIEGLVLDALRTGVPESRPWLIFYNVQAWLQGGLPNYRAFDQPQVCAPDGSCQLPELISTAHAGIYLLVLSVVLVAVGGAVFRRRDIN